VIACYFSPQKEGKDGREGKEGIANFHSFLPFLPFHPFRLQINQLSKFIPLPMSLTIPNPGTHPQPSSVAQAVLLKVTKSSQMPM